MPRARAPWWVLVIAASVLGYLALMTYAEVFGPGALGAGLRFRQGRVLVVEVVDGSPAAVAGLAAGDEVAAVNGLVAPTLLQWRLAAQNFEVARPVALDVRRGAERLSLRLALGPHWKRFSVGMWLVLAAKLVAQLVTLGLGLLIALRRPRDLVALVGASFLASLSITNLVPVAAVDPHAPSPVNGALAIWRALPVWLTPPLWIAATLFLCGPTLQTAFYGLFPRPLFQTRRAWVLWTLSWAPLMAWGLPHLLATFALGVYDPSHGVQLLGTGTTLFIGVGVLAASATAFTLLVLNYRRLADATQRRRIRVVVVGYVVGMGVTAAVAMSGFFDLPPVIQSVMRSPTARSAASVSFLLVPASLAYGILRHRLLDVGTIVRQGLQYALARRVALSVVPACAVLLAIDLVVHGNQPLLAVLQSRGWAYTAVAALAVLVHVRRQSWLEALDRRFFRERYDAQRLLGEVVDEIRRATNFEGVASRVVSRIESALHAEYVTLLARGPRQDAVYRFVASAPAPPTNFTLQPDSKIVRLVRLLGRPVETSAGDSGWLREQLPHDETTFLRDSRIGLIVPVALDKEGGRETLLVLGIKRSEEPYSREDQDLLQAVAGSLELLAGRQATSRSPDVAPAPADAELTLQAEGFAECVRCGACQDQRAGRCEQDGGELELVRLPRELAGRYRLMRRLGRGGMGSVYEAVDLALERRVAVKVIRDDIVGSTEAAERFRREARASAAVAHPNVVTVYDFGVAEGTRAFLVLELLRGRTLRDLLRQRGRLDGATTLSILRPICEAVEAAHRHQVVHRDLKPENVFLADEGDPGASPHSEPKTGVPHCTVKVLDFGIARFLSADQGQTTTIVTDRPIGTLHYMGPEQLRGGQPDRSWDMWALAVMAYEMLAGVLPFPSASAVDYQVAVLAARPVPITLELGAAASGLDPFFARALSGHPAERPPNPPSFADALAQALGHAVDAR